MALTSHASSYPFMANRAQPCFNYDVFISFRGEDTRKSFTDHLYTALKKAGINTFRDGDAIERGRQLKPELTKAIHESAISRIVFSKDYASSKWCLDEVLIIMEQHRRSSFKHEVVPVFYNVDPTDVRNQTGCFKEAFIVYDDIIENETDVQKKNEWLEKVKAWKGALNKAGSLTGMVLGEGYEAQFITNIVKDIRKKLDYNVLYIESKLVGMRNDVAKIESWLQDKSANSTVLLIHGMGGIGKTTIATCIFNLNCHDYDSSCFLADISETSNQPNGLLRLQSQLISQIKKSETKEKIWNVREGTTKVIKAICSKRILLVLDDVATSQQLDALLGEKRLCPGSKVIITTRDESLLNEFEIHPKVQAIETLCNDDSIKLFSLYAFHQGQPLEPYIIQSKLLVTHHCMGLPLALKVLGSYLRGKSSKEWREAMRRLKSIPLPGIQRVLQLSYESLEEDHDKDLFLHIACFFVGEDEHFIVKLLTECNLYPMIGIKKLSDRCLLYVRYGKVWMHQLIREMGKEVVRQESPKDPGKRTRLWRHEDCIDVLRENKGTKKVEGLMLDMQKTREDKSILSINMDNYSRKRSFEEYLGKTIYENEANFEIGALEKMRNLMLLQLNYVTFSGECNSLPNNLRLLRWHGFPLKSIPTIVPLQMLVALDMSYSKLERVWEDYKFIGSLKILNLSYCDDLMKTPDFSGLPDLESVILKGCKRLMKVDESITCLSELVFLDLSDCINLREFPDIPKSLVSLEMSGCPNLGVFEGFRFLDSTILPSSLVILNISDCNLFDNSFPKDWSYLVSLRNLRIDGNKITYLPKCIQSLPKLEYLEAMYCSKLQSVDGLPETVHEVYISVNESLEKIQLPPSKISIFCHTCPKLCDVEGYYKYQSMDKVEQKIIERLGLGSSMELGTLDYSKQKVVYEYGIFSTFITENQIPSCSSYTYIEKGPQISFRVPWNFNDSRVVTSFNMSLVFSEYKDCIWLDIQVYNKTKDLLWNYFLDESSRQADREKVGWVSLWRCGKLLDPGDEICIRILDEREDEVYMGVEECCINLIYDDNDNENVGEEHNDEEWERKEANNKKVISALDHIAWSDRMLTEISDCVHNGMTYNFEIYGPSYSSCAVRRVESALIGWIKD